MARRPTRCRCSLRRRQHVRRGRHVLGSQHLFVGGSDDIEWQDITIIGIDTCIGSGPEGPKQKDYHEAATTAGGSTFAGTLHRNILECGYGDTIAIMITNSHRASRLFADVTLDWVHLDARHDYESVRADITAWLPKVRSGGWLTGDDYDSEKWPEVVAAVAADLPNAQPWDRQQWRWIVPAAVAPTVATSPSGRRLRGVLRRR